MQKVDLSNLTLNQLSELTGRTYRTIKAKLKGVAPTKQDGKAYYFDPRAALPLIYELEKKPKADGTVLILNDEKARLAAAQADKTEMQVEQLRKNLLPADEVERVWSAMAMSFRAKMLVIPARAAPQVAGMKRPADCQALLRKMVEEALEELSEYGPEQFNLVGDEEGDGEAEAPAEPQGERVGGEVPIP